MITEIGLNSIASALQNIIVKARYIINGAPKDTEIFDKKLEGNKYTIRVYLDDNVVGKITNLQLVDSQGNIIVDKPDTVDKVNSKGLLYIFTITITEG